MITKRESFQETSDLDPTKEGMGGVGIKNCLHLLIVRQEAVAVKMDLLSREKVFGFGR